MMVEAAVAGIAPVLLKNTLVRRAEERAALTQEEPADPILDRLLLVEGMSAQDVDGWRKLLARMGKSLNRDESELCDSLIPCFTPVENLPEGCKQRVSWNRVNQCFEVQVYKPCRQQDRRRARERKKMEQRAAIAP